MEWDTRSRPEMNENMKCPMSLNNWAFGHFYRYFSAFCMRSMARFRNSQLSSLTGVIFEIGCGVGDNFDHYSSDSIVYAIEPNSTMFVVAQRKAAKSKAKIFLLQAGIGDDLSSLLPVEGVDCVVFSLVLCSIPNPSLAVDQSLAYLKPGGRVVMFEHVANTHSRIWFAIQGLLNPVWRRLFDGCQLTVSSDLILSRHPRLFMVSKSEFRVLGSLLPGCSMILIKK